MRANTEKRSTLAKAKHLQILVNFCRTVVRSEADLLELAIEEYEQFLRAQQHDKAA